MKFEKLLLISLSFFVSFTLPLQAAETLESLEAIWNSDALQSTAVAPNKPKSRQVSNAQRQQLIAARQKLKREALSRQRSQQAQKQTQANARKNAQHSATKNLAQQASTKLADAKLAKQRIIWKAKWDAEQRAKKQKLAKATQQNQIRNNIATSTNKIQQNTNNRNIDFTPAELALAAPKPVWNKTKQVAPKPLT